MFGLTWSRRGSRLLHFMLNINESFLKMELNLFWWCLIVCVICGGIDGVALLHGCACFVLITNRFYPPLQVTSLTPI